MKRFFSFVFASVFLISSVMVWASPFADTLRAEEGIESTEDRVEREVSAFGISFVSKSRKTFLPEVANLIDFSNLCAIQFEGLQSRLGFIQHKAKNTNIPIHIAIQVFLI
jgi:hypothetical protein